MSSWRRFKLDEFADVLDNFRVPVNEDERSKNLGTTPYYGANGLQGFINGWLFDEPLILIAEDGGYFEEYATRPVAYRIAGKSWVNNHAHILRPKNDFDFDFIFYSLQHKNITPFIKGGTRAKLNQKELREIEIYSPIDYKSQNSVSKVLSNASQAIEKTEALIEKYQQIKSGLMHDLFSRGIGVDGKLRPTREEAPELYQETPIGWIPNEWEFGSLTYYLDDSSGLKPGPFGSSIKKDSYVESGYKVYGQEQVIANDQNIGDYYIDSAKYKTLQDFSISENDLLISMVGTVGKILVIRSPFLQGIINPRLMRIRPNLKKVDITYLKYLMISESLKRQLEQLAGGGTMPVLNAKIVRKVKVPILKNIYEQDNIAKILDSIESKINSEFELLFKLKKQKSGLMNDLLTGKVKVVSKTREVSLV